MSATINLRSRLSQHETLAAEFLDLCEPVEYMLTVARLNLVENDDLIALILATRSKQPLHLGHAVFEGMIARRWYIEYLPLSLASQAYDIVVIAYLKRDTLPLGRVRGLDDGYSVLKVAAASEEFTVKRDVLREF